MQNSMFSGLFGSLSTEHRMAMISNNLANVNTTGYKPDTVSFKNTMIYFAHDFIREPLENLRSEPLFPEACLRSRTRIGEVETDFSQGSMQYTGNKLDVSIVGEGFFRVNSGESEFLTRAGNFTKDANGNLVTQQGFTVQGQGGPISIPANASNIYINTEGRIFADEAEVGQIDIVTLEDLQSLKKVGSNLYQAPEGAEFNDPRENNTKISQGYTEASKVNAVYEMVKMIEVQRYFEAQQKTMSTADQVDSITTNVAKPR